MNHNYDLRQNPKKSIKAKQMEAHKEGNNEMERTENRPSKDPELQTNTRPSEATVDVGNQSEDSSNEWNISETEKTNAEETYDRPTGGNEKNSDLALVLKQLQKLSDDQKQQTERLESKMEEGFFTVREEFKFELEKRLETQREEVQNQIKEQFAISVKQLETRMETQIRNLEGYTEAQLFVVKNEVSLMNQTLESQIVANQENIQNLEKNLPNLVANEMEMIVVKNNSKLEHQINNKYEEMNKAISRNLNLAMENERLVAEHESKINRQEEKIQAIEGLMKGKTTTTYDLQRSPDIIINHLGSTEYQLKLPNFSNKTRNPRGFLDQFNKYYENYCKRRNQQDCLSYLEIIEQCFEGSTSNWFQVVRDDLKNKEEFQTKFLNQYWSREIQKGIKRRIEAERYREDGKMSRMEYVIDRTLTLKAMIPPMEEEEIVNLLSDNFSERIQDSVRVQHIVTLDRLIELLNREDMDARTSRTKTTSYEPKFNREELNGQTKETLNARMKNDKHQDPYGRYIKFVPTGSQQNHMTDRHHPVPNTMSKPNQNYKLHYNYGNYQNRPNSFSQPANVPNHYHNDNYQNHKNRFPRTENRGINYIGTYRRRSLDADTYPTREQIYWTQRLRGQPTRQNRSLSPQSKTEDGHAMQNNNNARKPDHQRSADRQNDEISNTTQALN